MRTYGSLHVVIRPLLPIQPVINSCPSSFPSLCFNQAQRLCSVITTNSSRTLLLLNGGRKRNFRERTFSTPFAKEDKLFFFLPARRETVIKFHEFRAPVNVGRVKSKFKLCRKSDPIPSSLQVDGSVQGPLIPDKKGKSLGRRNEFFLLLLGVGGVREDLVLLAYFIAILEIIKKRPWMCVSQNDNSISSFIQHVLLGNQVRC